MTDTPKKFDSRLKNIISELEFLKEDFEIPWVEPLVSDIWWKYNMATAEDFAFWIREVNNYCLFVESDVFVTQETDYIKIKEKPFEDAHYFVIYNSLGPLKAAALRNNGRALALSDFDKVGELLE